MGYFDALTSSSFKTTPDGHRVFFPWGVFGRGYLIGSQPEYERLRRHVTMLVVVGMVLAIATMIGVQALWKLQSVTGLLAALVFSLVYMGFYAAWLPSLLRDLQPSRERLSLRESMATHARAHSPMLLWALEICSLGFVGLSVFIVASDPGKWLIAIAGGVFFGFCAAGFAVMLIMRQET